MTKSPAKKKNGRTETTTRTRGQTGLFDWAETAHMTGNVFLGVLLKYGISTPRNSYGRGKLEVPILYLSHPTQVRCPRHKGWLVSWLSRQTHLGGKEFGICLLQLRPDWLRCLCRHIALASFSSPTSPKHIYS